MQHKKKYINPTLVSIEIDSQICAVAMSEEKGNETPTLPPDEGKLGESMGMIGSNQSQRISNNQIFNQQMGQTSPF